MNRDKLYADALTDEVIEKLWDIRKQKYFSSETLDTYIGRKISDNDIREMSDLELLDYIKYNLYIDALILNTFDKLKTYTFFNNTKYGLAKYVAYNKDLDCDWPTINFVERQVKSTLSIIVAGYNLQDNKWKQWYKNPNRTFKDMPFYLRYGLGTAKKIKEFQAQEFTSQMLSEFIEDVYKS